MNRLSPEHIDLLLGELEELTRCRICSFVLIPPLFWCENGHGFCSTCGPQTTSCVICAANIRNLHPNSDLVHRLLMCLPRKCLFWAKGCHSYMPLKPLLHHENFKCPYRRVFCHIMDCSWEGDARNMPNHIRMNHAVYKTVGSFRLTLEDPNLDTYGVSVIEGYQNVFWMHYMIDAEMRKFYVFFVAMSTSEASGDFYAVTTFSKRNSSIGFKYTQKLFMEDVDVEEALATGCCLEVPLTELAHFIDPDGGLQYNYKIFKLPEEEETQDFPTWSLPILNII